jgi:hypothetical protein
MVAMVSAQFGGGSVPSQFSGSSGIGGYSGGVGSWQYYQPSFNRLYSGQVDTYWPILNRIKNDQCNATSDFIIGIPPGGCSPGVVRSDLLADQNVPVFCELYAIKVNPLIKVSSIRSISFKGDYPDGVSGIAFHPARAAVKSYDTLLGDPLINNIGYVVIIMKREKVEENLEDWVAGNLTATIRYDADEAYGTGRSEFYLPVMSDDEWKTDYARNAFWNGRGYLRLESVSGDRARVQLLTSRDKVVRTFSLRVGETTPLSYLPGYYCRAGLKVKLNGIVAPEDSALLNIDGEQFWVRDGSKFLNGKCWVNKIDVDKNRVGNISVGCTGNSKITFGLSERGGEPLSDERWDNEVDDYFLKAHDSVKELVEVYGSEAKETGEAFGEEALWEQIILAESLNKSKTQAELMDVFIDSYPSSKIVDQVRYRRQLLNGTDFGASTVSVYVNNKFHTIGVVDFREVNESKGKVSLKIGTKDESFGKDGEFDLGEKRKLVIKDIVPGKVRVAFESSKKGVKSRTVWIDESQQDSFYGVDVYVRDIEVNEVAYLELIPEVKHTKTEADFSFRVGIEKRGIELSPAKTKEKLSNLNASIEKWEGIVERLGNVVKGMKGACFATSTVLMLKNAVTGFGGAAVARTKVMARYKAECDRDYPDLSRTACYNELSPDIERDVDAMTLALNKVNSDMDAAQAGNIDDSGGLFGGEHVVDQEKYIKALRDKVTSSGISEVDVDVGGGKIVKVPISEIDSVSQLRAVLLSQELGDSGVSAEAAKAEMDLALRNTALLVEADKDRVVARQELIDAGVGDVKVQTYVSEDTTLLRWDSETEGDDKIQYLNYKGRNYRLYLIGTASGNMGIDRDKSRVHDGTSWGAIADPDVLEAFGNIAFAPVGVGECNNEWPQGKAKVSYYEAGASKGLPAIVPFDLKNGWYAMVPNSGGTFLDNSPQGYTASADVRYFKICNIGNDRLMQSGQGDDLCQTFSVDSAGSVDDFIPCPDLTPDKVKRLFNRGREAIRQASDQHGKKVIRILDQMMELGNPMSQVGGFECQDFMSAEECKLMFNVCDPVICPPSRCNLGGKMPVSDVIQTGIIGGIVLCLPNAADGVIAPICLSGIHAGLDNYLSILRSHKDCLEQNLENGEHVGICDEITSIYKCEFFWRQMSPVLDQLLPSVVAGIIAPGQRVRGGGEYALVQQSWNTMQQSVSYFRDVYAQNAFRAFQLKNTEEAGSEICRAFIGTSVPGSADMLDSLLEPESPSQFYAQFSERLFSEATVPSTSQYKVYYHIYAGNDKGVQYRVYLKNPPATSYYASNPSVWVDSGYIAKGASADESVDFTAPSGYKELCVVIDAKEECGFKSVTTDFGLDFIKDKYVQEQAEKSDITTESECISGSPSALSMANLNLQAGSEEVVNPDIALRGIVRVCASRDPGEGTGDPRWKDVGYCGDNKMTCWLDTDSIKDDLGRIEAVENTSLAVLNERRGLIENTKMTLEEVRKVLSSARGGIKGLNNTDLNSPGAGEVAKIIVELTEIIGAEDIGGAGTNADRAEALGLRASVYRMVVEVKRKVAKVIPKPVPVSRDVDECKVDGDCGADPGYEPFCDSGVCRMRAVVGASVGVEMEFEYNNKKYQYEQISGGDYSPYFDDENQKVFTSTSMVELAILGGGVDDNPIEYIVKSELDEREDKLREELTKNGIMSGGVLTESIGGGWGILSEENSYLTGSSSQWKFTTESSRYGGYFDNDEKGNPISCGPNALFAAFNRLNPAGSYNLRTIDTERESFGGLIRRKFLSIFSDRAKYITWPHEISGTVKKYGFDVENVGGLMIGEYVGGGKIALLDKARRATEEGKVVIAHISVDVNNKLVTRHWTIYDYNGGYYDLLNPAEYYPLYGIYILSNKEDKSSGVNGIVRPFEEGYEIKETQANYPYLMSYLKDLGVE